MVGQSTIWFESTIRKHTENCFFLRPDVRGGESKGERLNQNLLITESIALKDKSKEKAEELKILKRKTQELEEEKAKKMKLYI